MTPAIKSIFKSISPFTEEELNFLEPYIKPVVLRKNETLIAEGQICKHIFLVEQGCLRNFYNNDGSDVNLNFTMEGQFFTSFESYANREPSKIIIQAMEKSLVWIINSRAFPKEHEYYTTFSTFIRRLFIRLLLTTEEHHNMMRMNTPAERYEYILKNKPEMIQRIPLTHVASYIGITRETLSRIRSNSY
ncbi:cAMP-binding domain of CRP or a regulatory subunit of cAMP-dependent protein kinases [Pedobacter westerhofensis]|uniref:cAMP-binding domain of CRP or a regulatory subunit of cAMP-dependent protein kinases n=1 Tax=Pedobacter westerhofensis TaxID=425512 RepID=A0A521E696_9SPHI|nr:Crp/Fnr family transcriptional regulator [Pedobacter westerhofensis]SMO78710.1 cAMP-binding domain of CRP or a regulatory subunit of cAMP-dependent protein kinases [Pedobacter westerhofensis]